MGCALWTGVPAMWWREIKSQAVGCWREARSVPLVDVGVLSESRCARTAGGVHIAHKVVGAGPFGVRLVDDGLCHVGATWEIPVGVKFTARLASFSRLVRFDKRGAGFCDPVLLHEISGLELGEVGLGAEPCPPDAGWAKPDLDAGADAMRHLYDHPDVARKLGRGARGERYRHRRRDHCGGLVRRAVAGAGAHR